MPRLKRGVHRNKRRKNILARTKGMMWGRKSKLTQAKIAAVKAGLHAYVGRKLKKRNNRALQQVRINAAARQAGTNYSLLMHSLKEKNIKLDRKILSTLADQHPNIFKQLVS